MKWVKVKKQMYKNSQTYRGDVYIFWCAHAIDGRFWKTSFEDNGFKTLKEAKQALDDLTCYTLYMQSAA